MYFDASALVKLLIEEQGSDVAVSLWDGSEIALTSRLTHPEVSAALAAARRNHVLTAPSHSQALENWNDLRDALRMVELTPAIEQRAGTLAAVHALRGADAVHLASALAVDSPELIVVAWDRRLRAGAVAERLRVAPGSAGDP